MAVAFLSNRLLLQKSILGNGRFILKAARDTNVRHAIDKWNAGPLESPGRAPPCSRIGCLRQESPIVNPLLPRFCAHEGRFLANRVHDGVFMA